MIDTMTPLPARCRGDAPLASRYYSTTGSAAGAQEREPLVLLHGWGWDSDSWSPLLPALRNMTSVVTLDLPGFGDSPARPGLSWGQLLDLVERSLPPRAILMGWSLGGMLAVALAARCPERVSRVITLASNLRFVANNDWPQAMASADYEAFSRSFDEQPQTGLRRFLGLVACGDRHERDLRRALSDCQPAVERINPGWRASLALLAGVDNRGALAALRQPGLHLFAERDALVPLSAAAALPQLNPRQRIQVAPGAGHALHWSQPEWVAEQVRDFLQVTGGQLDKRRVASSFSRAAPSYDSVARLQRAVGEELFHQLGDLAPASGQRLLDLGSGTGYFTERLAQRLAPGHILGLDLAEGMLQFSRRERAPGPVWLCADAEQLPLADASIDLVFSSLSFQWCEQLPKALAEVQRVLRPGGQLVFSTLGPRTLWELKSAWQAVDGYVHVNRFMPLHSVHQALEMAGLEPLSWRRDERVLRYRRMAELTRELKALGAHNVNRGQPEGLTGRHKIQALKAAYETYRQAGLLPATYEVFYCRAHKPQ